MTWGMADGICGRLDQTVEWPYIVLPILDLPQFNGWRVDVVNAKTLARLTLVDVGGLLIRYTIPQRAE